LKLSQKQKQRQTGKPKRYLFTLSSNLAPLPHLPAPVSYFKNYMNKIWLFLLAQQDGESPPAITSTQPTHIKGTAVITSPPSTGTNHVEELGLGSDKSVAHPIRSFFVGVLCIGGVLGLFVWWIGTEKVRRIMANAGVGAGGFRYRKVSSEDLER
jgi:hypothetical protein